MKKTILFLTLFLALFIPYTQSQEIFFDYSDISQFDAWEEYAGFWDIADGEMFEFLDAGGPLAIVTGDTDLTDFTIGVKAKGYVADADWGVIFRFQDIGNFYSWQFVNGALDLIMYAGGTRTQLFTTPQAEALDEWQDFKVVVNGDTFECYWNGELKATVTDATHAAGQVGLFGWVNAGSTLGDNPGFIAYDDFYVTAQEQWTVARVLPSEGYRLGQSIQGITLQANVAQGQTVTQLVVTETVPQGLTASNIAASAGTFTNTGGVITWTVNNASGSPTLTYNLAAPTDQNYGDILFSGTASAGTYSALITSTLPFIFEDWLALSEPIFFDFEDAAQDDAWEDLAGDWGIEDGLFYEFLDAGGPLVTLTGDPNVTDYVLTVNAMGLQANADWGIIFRAKDIANFYSWQFVNGNLQLIMYNQGARSTLFTVAQAEVLNEWQEFKADVQQDTFDLYWNGDLIASVTNSVHAWGRIGLFGWVNAGSPVADTIGGIVYDDFSAAPPTDVTDWMMY